MLDDGLMNDQLCAEQLFKLTSCLREQAVEISGIWNVRICIGTEDQISWGDEKEVGAVICRWYGLWDSHSSDELAKAPPPGNTYLTFRWDHGSAA